MADDEQLERLRSRIDALDRAIVAALNERLSLVAEMKELKERLGLPFRDDARERELAAALVAENGGPLSARAVREIHAEILRLMREELAAEAGAGR